VPPLFGIKQKFFYPRIAYDSPVINVDFDDPVSPVILPVSIRADAVAEDGTRESLFRRIENQVRFTGLINKTLLDLIYTFWKNWGALGKQATLTLDRLSTCAGQFEFDSFNAFFTKAEVTDLNFQLVRAVPARIVYGVTLTFRQGK
jgi:hypothetical protein